MSKKKGAVNYAHKREVRRLQRLRKANPKLLKQSSYQKVGVRIKQINQEAKQFETLNSDVELATREKLAWDKGWDRGLTKLDRAKFERAWHESFQASGGRITPDAAKYGEAVRRRHAGKKATTRVYTPDKFLEVSIRKAYGYDNENNVIAIAERLKAEAGEHFDLIEPIYNYLMSHSATMPASIMQSIFEVVYEKGIDSETIKEIEALLPV